MKNVEKHLKRIVHASLQRTPEQMLDECLQILIDITGATGGSILEDEGTGLTFLFSDVKPLIGRSVPWDSIAGTCVSRNILIYTYAPSDKRHFEGVDAEIARSTRYLLSIPVPSIHNARTGSASGRARGALQLLFDRNVFPDYDVTQRPAEFSMEDIRDHEFYAKSLQEVFTILANISMGMEIMTLRQTSYQAIHELKNKLISAKSWFNCLKEDLEDRVPEVLEDEDIREDISLAEDAVASGSKIAVDYLQFTKIYNPQFAEVNINDVLREVSHDIRAFTVGAGGEGCVAVSFVPGDGIPIRSLDPSQLKMAFFNLGKNAGEALLEHRISSPAITLSSACVDGKVRVTVCDNGHGMPEEIAANLFVAFKTKKAGGTGLGLTITKKIVDVHGGTIRCDTGPQGTRFTVEF